MFSYRTLEGIPLEELHKAFLEAFSDYVVKIDMPFERLKSKLKMDGFDPQFSMGAFRENDLVGFIFNGYRDWQGKATVYDGGTGVVPECRKQGVTTSMFIEVCGILREKGVEQYLLEVIQENTPAVNLYRNQGFETLRELICYRAEKEKLDIRSSENARITTVYDINELDWEVLKNLWEYHPTWQNSIASVRAAAEEFAAAVAVENDAAVGYGIINKKSGSIPQLAVGSEYKKKGIGRSIIVELLKLTAADKISMINVDSMSDSTCAFLEKSGFAAFIKQYEMALKL